MFVELVTGAAAAYGETVFKLVLSVVLGGLIGYERQAAHKPAGLRTNVLVCLGTTIFVVVALMTFESYPDSPVDVTRVAAGIITGVGFLGAGTIMRTSTDIQGLTSAATIWFVCGIGMATGMGFYALAVIGTFLGFLILRAAKYLGKSFE